MNFKAVVKNYSQTLQHKNTTLIFHFQYFSDFVEKKINVVKRRSMPNCLIRIKTNTLRSCKSKRQPYAMSNKPMTQMPTLISLLPFRCLLEDLYDRFAVRASACGGGAHEACIVRDVGVRICFEHKERTIAIAQTHINSAIIT